MARLDTWIHHNTPEAKHERMSPKYMSSPVPRKFKAHDSTFKVKAIVRLLQNSIFIGPVGRKIRLLRKKGSIDMCYMFTSIWEFRIPDYQHAQFLMLHVHPRL